MLLDLDRCWPFELGHEGIKRKKLRLALIKHWLWLALFALSIVGALADQTFLFYDRHIFDWTGWGCDARAAHIDALDVAQIADVGAH